MVGTKKAIHYLSSKDVRLKKLMKTVGNLDFATEKKISVFEMLARAIANQQLNGKAAQTILNRFKALTPGRGFPKPADVLKLKDEDLRGVGFSWAKVAALKDLSSKIENKLLPTRKALEAMDDEAVVQTLIQVRGIGRWTAEMLLIFQLGRADILPVDDFGVRSGFQILFGLDDHPKPKVLAEYGEKWRPHRTTASLYLWRAVDTKKKKSKKINSKRA